MIDLLRRRALAQQRSKGFFCCSPGLILSVQRPQIFHLFDKDLPDWLFGGCRLLLETVLNGERLRRQPQLPKLHGEGELARSAD